MQQDKDLTNALLENEKVDYEIRKKQKHGEIDLNKNPVEDEDFIQNKIQEAQKELDFWIEKKNEIISKRKTESEKFPDVEILGKDGHISNDEYDKDECNESDNSDFKSRDKSNEVIDIPDYDETDYSSRTSWRKNTDTDVIMISDDENHNKTTDKSKKKTMKRKQILKLNVDETIQKRKRT